MSAELEVVSKALVDIDAVGTGLEQLRQTYGGIVYEVTTPAGMEAAKAARLAIREPRYNVERIRKAAKKPILDLGKKLDAEAARIEGELLKIENPIHEQIVNEELRKETERQAKVDAEIARQKGLQGRVDELRGVVAVVAGCNATQILERISEIERITVDETFEEYRQQAEDAKNSTLAQLGRMHAAAVEAEAEKERVRIERAELARLRAEDEARQATERARIAEEDRVAREAREAEAARVAEENRIERERIAAERAESDRIERERKEAADVEQRILDELRARLAREQEALRVAQQPKAEPAAPTRGGKKVKVPNGAEIVQVLAKHYGAHPDTVIDWLTSIDWRMSA